MAVENARGLVVQNAFELLVAFAMRHVVVHLQIVLHMLFLVDEIKSIHLGVSTFAIQINVISISHIATVEGDDHNLQAAVGHLLDLEFALDGSLITDILKHIQLKTRVFVEDDFGHLRICREMCIVVILNDFATLVGGYDKLVVHNQSSLIHS